TMRALETALSLGMDRRVQIATPLMWLTKAATWALAEDLGGRDLVDLIVSDTHTCYLGERGRKHDWGQGCGSCPACSLRAKGFYEWTSARS
ncbi:MAG TPA: 7-cyano-7-deazaguanine synthase, partial [Hyphomicrobiaceae bacterium]|nr:7-cyano-7-deazaguanine synthase [Hyphomicrobiaceae bacterium]